MTTLKFLPKTINLFLTGSVFFIFVIAANTAFAQCSIKSVPKSICAFDDVIDSFSFNGDTANNTSCNGPNGYSYHGSIYGFTATPGDTVSVSAKLGAGYNNQGMSIWIDFNNNHFFDTSEYVFSAGPDTAVSGTISVPNDAISTTVRMRVMSRSGSIPMPGDACTVVGGYGETEDYDLSILPVDSNNAAVLAITSPTAFCAGTEDIYVQIANLGTNQIDSVEVHWEFNGIPQTPAAYIGLLDTLNGFSSSSVTVFLGNKLFGYGTENTIKVWTSLPNGIPDGNNMDDTISVVKKAAITGNLTLDPSLPASSTNYIDFSSFAYDLNNYGICGPVNISVSPGTYNEYFSLHNIFGSSSTNSITIDGIDSSMVTLSHDGKTKNSTVSIVNSSYISIKNMSIEFLGMNGGSVVSIDESSYIDVSNNELRIDTNAGSFDLINVLMQGVPCSYNQISNNRIVGGAIGIGMRVNVSPNNSNNKVINNGFEQIIEKGISVNNQDSVQIIGNKIDVRTEGFMYSYGIEMINTFNSQLFENYIHAVSTGVDINNFINSSAPNRKIAVVNNMIISDGTGLIMSGIDSINIYHNSISALGNQPAFTITNMDTLPKRYDVRNNILSSGLGLSVKSTEPLQAYSNLDFNAYYSGGADLFEINNSTYTDLSALNSAFPGYNNFSVDGNPQFVSASNDLHINGNMVNDIGDNSLGVSNDIDGDPRPFPSSINVDIGADEFDPPSCPKPHDLFVKKPTIDSVEIGWIGNGISFYFEYLIVPTGNGTGNGNAIAVQNDTILVGGLDSSTTYDLYVREVCARGDTSLWAGPYTFRTAEVLDYFEDFSGFEMDELSRNWESISYASNPSLEWSVDTVSFYSSVIKDHTIGTGGTFAYFKTNFGPGEAVLKSPPIFVGPGIGSFTFSFWYYMNGADIGSLEVYIDTTLITSISGQQQTSSNDPWLFFDTVLTSYSSQYVNLNFKATKGFGVMSEIAVDDIQLDSVMIVGLDENNIGPDETISIYPNPGSGTFYLVSKEISGEVLLDVISMNGKTIYQDKLKISSKKSKKLNLNSLPRGIYYIRIITKNNLYVKKLVLMD